jgi:hypothetical protein
MTGIDVVTIIPEFLLYFEGVPTPDSPALLQTDPGSLYVGSWEFNVLSLALPEGGQRDIRYSKLDDALCDATRAWDTPAGRAVIESRRGAARWTGARRHEWRQPVDLVALVQAEIQRAGEQGILPWPRDYEITWCSDHQALCIHTHHALVRKGQITEAVEALLTSFKAP